jgi:serine/threonine protein phosphatase PrpC
MPNNRDESWELSHSREDIPPQPTTKPTSLTYAVGAGSDPGKRRKRNEESICAASSREKTPLAALPFGLFVVADGMGGYYDGQEASCSAIQAMIDALWSKIGSFSTIGPEACTILLAEAVQKANEAVNQQNSNLESRIGAPMMEDDGGLCTTLTAAMLVGSTASIANVGDCRTYLYRAKEGLEKVTTDHLVVARLIEEGVLTPEEVYTHPKRNQVYRALYNQPRVEVDLFTVPLQPGDVILLCSMSLWNVVRDSQIEDIIRSAPSDPSQVTSVLIQTALDRSGRDNVSVIVVSMVEAQDQALVPSVQLLARPESIHLPQT